MRAYKCPKCGWWHLTSKPPIAAGAETEALFSGQPDGGRKVERPCPMAAGRERLAGRALPPNIVLADKTSVLTDNDKKV